MWIKIRTMSVCMTYKNTFISLCDRALAANGFVKFSTMLAFPISQKI